MEKIHNFVNKVSGKNKCLNRVFLNSGWIYTISFYKDWVFLGLDDKSIKIYSQKSLELLEELFGHDNLVSCLAFNELFLFSGSYDHTIRSWDLVEITNRIRERKIMENEELMSRKMEAYNKIMDKTKKKGKNKEKNQEKEEKTNTKTKEKTKEKSKEKTKEKSQGKSKEKSKEKSQGKSKEKSKEKKKSTKNK